MGICEKSLTIAGLKIINKLVIRMATPYEEDFKMNKVELVAAVAAQAGLSKKDAEKAVKAFTETVSAELAKGGKVQLVGFGTFEVSERAAREGRNPLTKEKITIAASKTPKFKAGKALKDMVNA